MSASPPQPDEAPAPQGLLARLDRGVYAAEQGIITGSLLMMTLTYFLAIVHREMQSEVNAFDKLFLRLQGYPTIGEAKAVEGVIEATTTLYTPLMLGIVAFIMAVLALLTRERTMLAEQPDSDPVRLVAMSWPKRLGLSVVLVGVVWGLLTLVKITPARSMCLLSLAGMVGPALWLGIKHRQPTAVVSALLGGGLMAWFFMVRVQTTYIWSSELSNVLLMYVGFLGASMATKDGRHIKVDAVRKRIAPKNLPLYNAVSGVVTVLFCLFLLVLTVQYMMGRIDHGLLLEATELPEVIMSLPIGFALLLMVLRFSAEVARDFGMFRRGEVAADTGPELH